MLHVDMPTRAELAELFGERSDACVSLYLPTTPVTAEVGAARIELGNLIKAALGQLEAAGLDKRRLLRLREALEVLPEDDAFWAVQARSLAVLATPDRVRTWRLPNRLVAMAEVSDRFHLKPLLRSVTFPHEALVLALSAMQARLVEVTADLPARVVPVPGMPSDAADATRRTSVNRVSASGRIQGHEGQKVLLSQYARAVDGALRAALAGLEVPVILAATEPLASIFRGLTTLRPLLPEGIDRNADEVTEHDLALAARPLLERLHEAEIAELTRLFARRAGERRTTTDISIAARAATHGGIAALLVDMDEVVPGAVDPETGAVTFAAVNDAVAYGVVDEIAGRALLTGARVLAVRRADIPGGGSLAAILRYAAAG